MPESIKELFKKIEKSRKSSPLAAGDVRLLGAAKGQGADNIIRVLEAGVVDFGENRVQEAQEKWPLLRKDHPEVRLHLIGPLQTNKVKQAVGLFDVIQTVDREKLVDALVAEMEATGKQLDCYIQVNIGKEPQKAGVMPEDAEALLGYAKQKGLKIVGLMCVPPVGQHPAPYFAALKQMAGNMGLSELSMGMSEDFETAVRMGATCVRLGRVLFGERTVSAA